MTLRGATNQTLRMHHTKKMVKGDLTLKELEDLMDIRNTRHLQINAR